MLENNYNPSKLSTHEGHVLVLGWGGRCPQGLDGVAAVGEGYRLEGCRTRLTQRIKTRLGLGQELAGGWHTVDGVRLRQGGRVAVAAETGAGRKGGVGVAQVRVRLGLVGMDTAVDHRRIVVEVRVGGLRAGGGESTVIGYESHGSAMGAGCNMDGCCRRRCCCCRLVLLLVLVLLLLLVVVMLQCLRLAAHHYGITIAAAIGGGTLLLLLLLVLLELLLLRLARHLALLNGLDFNGRHVLAIAQYLSRGIGV